MTELAAILGASRQYAHQLLCADADLYATWRWRRQQLRQQRVESRLQAWQATEQGSILMRAARELSRLGHGGIAIEKAPNCPYYVMVGGVRLRWSSPRSSFTCGYSTRYFRVQLHVDAFTVVSLVDGRRCVFVPDHRQMVYLPDSADASYLPRSLPVVAWRAV